jgi:translation initiation factor 5B
MEKGFNAALYYENKKLKQVVNIVPTSAVRYVSYMFCWLHYKGNALYVFYTSVFSLTYTIIFTSGEGIPDLLMLLVRWVPKIMMERLTYVNTVEVCSGGHFCTIVSNSFVC